MAHRPTLNSSLIWSSISSLKVALPYLFVCILALVATQHQARADALALQNFDHVGFDDAVAGRDGERVVDLYLRVLSEFGAPIKGLQATDIEVWEDDAQIPAEELVINSLDTTGRGITAVLAIDASGTMRGEPFLKAREAAMAFVEQLRPEDRVAVLTFAEDINEVSRFSAQRAETRDALENLEIDLERSRHTLLYDGAFRAIDMIRTSPDIPRRAFVILFSDGKDDGSDRTREDVLREAMGREGDSHILNFAVGYARFGGAGLEEMRALAEGTGGEYQQAASVEDVGDFFDLVAKQMTQSYLVTYPSDMDGEPHNIRVTLAGKSGERLAYFPDIAGPRWPWFLGLAGVVLVGLIGFLFSRRGTVGRLSIKSGASAGTQVALKKGKTRIGALEDNEVVLDGTKVSRYHAEVTVRGGVVEISDLDSTNGTKINGQLVQRGPLHIGDQITVGDVELSYDK